MQLEEQRLDLLKMEYVEARSYLKYLISRIYQILYVATCVVAAIVTFGLTNMVSGKETNELMNLLAGIESSGIMNQDNILNGMVIVVFIYIVLGCFAVALRYAVKHMIQVSRFIINKFENQEFAGIITMDTTLSNIADSAMQYFNIFLILGALNFLIGIVFPFLIGKFETVVLLNNLYQNIILIIIYSIAILYLQKSRLDTIITPISGIKDPNQRTG